MLSDIELKKLVSSLSGEFLDECQDHLDLCDQVIQKLSDDPSDAGGELDDLRRSIHTIKGTGGTFGFPSITTIAHKLEDYMEAHRAIERHLGDLQYFVDSMREICENRVDPSEQELTAILGALPKAHHTYDIVAPHRVVSIMLVMERGVQRRIIGQELASCGFELSFVDNGIEAIQVALTMQPDIIISSYDLRDISGLDLAYAMNVMSKTDNIRFVLMSSSEKHVTHNRALPDGTSFVEKGPQFAETLSELLMEWGYFGDLNNGPDKISAVS